MRNRQRLRILAPLLLLATALAVATAPAPAKFPAGLQVLVRLEPSRGDIVRLQAPPGSREPVVYMYSLTAIEPSHPETSHAHAETVVLPDDPHGTRGQSERPSDGLRRPRNARDRNV